MLEFARREVHHRAALDDEHVAVGNRFGREGVFSAGLEAKDVTGQIERADLAAAVGQHLVGAHCAADDLVEIFGRLGLAVDFGVATKSHLAAHHLERAVEVRLRGWVDRECEGGLAGRDLGLMQHGRLLKFDGDSLPNTAGTENSDQLLTGLYGGAVDRENKAQIAAISLPAEPEPAAAPLAHPLTAAARNPQPRWFPSRATA